MSRWLYLKLCSSALYSINLSSAEAFSSFAADNITKLFTLSAHFVSIYSR